MALGSTSWNSTHVCECNYQQTRHTKAFNETHKRFGLNNSRNKGETCIYIYGHARANIWGGVTKNLQNKIIFENIKTVQS